VRIKCRPHLRNRRRTASMQHELADPTTYRTYHQLLRSRPQQASRLCSAVLLRAHSAQATSPVIPRYSARATTCMPRSAGTGRPCPQGFHDFVESDRYIAFETSHHTYKYQLTARLGRASGAVTLFLVPRPTQSALDGPVPEYDFYAFTISMKANMTLYLGAALNQNSSRPLKYMIGDEKW
jgi:hypothetical protein